ncbi:MAG: hypothetical protein J4F45_09185, partial [Pseudomonadales bacterium]|nr:hypothetical protein [Pseudomonadales bacterium]
VSYDPHRNRIRSRPVTLNSHQKTLLGVAAALVALCVVARLLPHPPNFAPATAVALFGCMFFARRWHAGAVVAAGMLAGDWFIGFYDIGVMVTVYASMLMPLAARRFLRQSSGVARVAAVALLSGVGFYLTTNAAVWFFTGAYPPTAEGLAASYVAGLPFLKWTLLGNLFYAAILFGGLELLKRRVGGMATATAHV